MSLLDVCKEVAKDCGFAVPASIVGNADDTAVQLLALANKGGRLLARKPWQALQKEFEIETTSSESYDLPDDYGWFVNQTAWDRTSYWRLRGSVSPQRWQALKSGILSASPRADFRLKGNLIWIHPAPSGSASRDLVVEYISNGWVRSGSDPAYTYHTSFLADTDTTLFDEALLQLDLTWRFLKAKGLAYLEDKHEADVQVDLAMARDTPSDAVNLAGAPRGDWPPAPHWAGTGIGS